MTHQLTRYAYMKRAKKLFLIIELISFFLYSKYGLKPIQTDTTIDKIIVIWRRYTGYQLMLAKGVLPRKAF